MGCSLNLEKSNDKFWKEMMTLGEVIYEVPIHSSMDTRTLLKA